MNSVSLGSFGTSLSDGTVSSRFQPARAGSESVVDIIAGRGFQIRVPADSDSDSDNPIRELSAWSLT